MHTPTHRRQLSPPPSCILTGAHKHVTQRAMYTHR